jgi:glutathione S-transferase
VKPLLWHLPISHYSEKVRWTLDWKRLPHRRRIMPPGLHPFGGLVLTRGQVFTMPVLAMDGRAIGDSTSIIAALEERFPSSRPLYPADSAERARALELEDWFDENVGPYARRWAFNALLSEPDAVRAFAQKQIEWAPWMSPDIFAPLAKAFLAVRYSTASDAAAEEARVKLVEGLDRLEAELDGRDFLVGERFTIADLTAAALFYPLVLPADAPWHPVRTAAFDVVQAAVAERPGFRWVEETWRRWRRAG